jgi:hypothetical protein
MTARLMVLNGPNLNLLGIREPHEARRADTHRTTAIYGDVTGPEECAFAARTRRTRT